MRTRKSACLLVAGMLAQSRCGCRSRHSPEVRVIFSNYPFDRYAGELIRIFFPLDFQYKWNLVETKMQKKKKRRYFQITEPRLPRSSPLLQLARHCAPQSRRMMPSVCFPSHSFVPMRTSMSKRELRMINKLQQVRALLLLVQENSVVLLQAGWCSDP